MTLPAEFTFTNNEAADNLLKTLSWNHFPWFLHTHSIYHDGDDTTDQPKYPTMTHSFVTDGQISSSYYADIIPVYEYIKSTGVVGANPTLFRCRANLTFGDRALVGEIQTPHVDLNVPHINVLYYVSDSEGPTYLLDDNDSVTHTVFPKKQKILVFNGLTRHAASYGDTGETRMLVVFSIM